MKIDKMILQLDTAFKGSVIKPSDCIEYETGQLFYIEDNELAGKCITIRLTLSEVEKQKYFEITNERANKVAVWSVDGCFLSSKQSERCDCIFFDEKDFCFVEFKLNATSSNPKTILENRSKAVRQLRGMFGLIKKQFDLHRFNFVGYSLEAYVCTPIFYPNKNTALSDFAVEFLEDHGVKLFEANKKNMQMTSHVAIILT